MNTWSLALRNLLRNRRRSITTVLAMTVGLIAILLFGGYRSNLIYSLHTGFVQHTGHLQIQRQGYYLDGGDNPTSYGIADYQRIIDLIKQDSVLAPMLTVVTPTLSLGGVAGNFAAGVSRSVRATGLKPDEYNQMMTWNDFDVVSYALPLPLTSDNEDGVVIGTGVARNLKLCGLIGNPAGCKSVTSAPSESKANEGNALPDDIAALSSLEQQAPNTANQNHIEMLSATAHGAPNVASLNVVKANNQGIKAIDDIYMGMHISQAQRLIYGTDAPQVTAIIIQLHHTDQIPAARQRLETLLTSEVKKQSLEIIDFRTLNPLFGQTNDFLGSIFGFVSVLIGIIVLFTIGNTMSSAVLERTVEIGTLRAMGLRRAGIRRLFMSEALLLAIIGAITGTICSLFIAYIINHSGWAWIPPGYSYAYLVLVRVGSDIPLLVGCIIGLFIVTMLSAWWPARRASNLEIVDALRHG